MPQEKLILVDEKDNVIGSEEKNKCHEGRGILHRAFTIFIFNNQNQVLLQRRSEFKKLWPLFWDGSCAGHPRENEDFKESAERRLKEELGIECDLKMIDKFQYQANYKNIGSENEICAILTGRYNGEIKPNLKEVAELRWINKDELRQEIFEKNSYFTPWLKISLEKI